jgi:hypothetical protein
MNIHQVCVNYINEHDRFLVRINTLGEEEVRLWFTRRLTLGLLPLLEKASQEQLTLQTKPIKPIDPLEAQRQHLLDNFKLEAATYNGDYKTPYREETATLPLGAEPLLVTEIKMTPLASGDLQIDILEKLGDKTRHLHLALDAQLTRGLVSLLNKGMNSSRWLETDIAVAVNVNRTTQAEAQDQEQEPLLAAPDADKPRYLN